MRSYRTRWACGLATLVATLSAAQPAQAFFCFSFSFGGSPRIGYWTPASTIQGPWYGPYILPPSSGAAPGWAPPAAWTPPGQWAGRPPFAYRSPPYWQSQGYPWPAGFAPGTQPYFGPYGW